MATTVPMLAPDGTSGEIPADKVQSAMQAGFKQAVEMTSPDGKAGYIPIERQQDALRAGFKPAGQQSPGFSVSSVLSGTDPLHRAIDQAAQTEPVDTSSVGGFARSVANDLGAGAVRVFQPLAHPLNTVGGLLKAGGQIATGNTYDAATPAIRQIVQNPSGEAVAAIPQAALAAAGAESEPAQQAANAIDRSGSGGGLVTNAAQGAKATGAKFLPALVDGPPESLLTRAVKPGKNNVGWSADAQTAIPLMKSAEQTLGTPITGVDDAIDAAVAAKKNIWQQYQQFTAPGKQLGATIDGNQIADAMMDTIGPRAKQQNPALVDRITQQADAYRRPMTLDEAEEFLSGKQGVNADLQSYYAKNKVGRRAAEADPEMAATVAEGDALRDALYSKIDEISGPGAAQLKQQYGALSNVESELRGRQLVAARQNPESLQQQLSTVSGVGKIAKGIFTMNPGDVLEGAQNITVSRAIAARNSSDAMIQRAFEAAPPADALPTPSVRAPQTTNLLPQQAGGKITLLPPDPGMTPGEQTAAAMHSLRQVPQLRLPANAQPIQLPSATDLWNNIRNQ